MTRSQTCNHRGLVAALVAACRRLRAELAGTGHAAPCPEAVTVDDLAQAVTLALLYARLSGAAVTLATLHDLGARLAVGDPSLGRALQHLADSPPAPGRAATAGPASAPLPPAPRDQNRNRKRKRG